MKINDWSALPTADKEGIALMPIFQDDHEIAVAIRNGRIEVNIYVAGQDAAVASMSYTMTKMSPEI